MASRACYKHEQRIRTRSAQNETYRPVREGRERGGYLPRLKGVERTRKGPARVPLAMVQAAKGIAMDSESEEDDGRSSNMNPSELDDADGHAMQMPANTPDPTTSSDAAHDQVLSSELVEGYTRIPSADHKSFREVPWDILQWQRFASNNLVFEQGQEDQAVEISSPSYSFNYPPRRLFAAARLDPPGTLSEWEKINKASGRKVLGQIKEEIEAFGGVLSYGERMKRLEALHKGRPIRPTSKSLLRGSNTVEQR